MKIAYALAFTAVTSAFVVTMGITAATAAGYDNECLANFNKKCCDKIFAQYPAGTLARPERMSKLAACVAGEKK